VRDEELGVPKSLREGYTTGRPPTGELRKCALCQGDIYIRAYILQKRPDWGILCKECQQKYLSISAGHCPRCKGNLISTDDSSEVACLQCGRHYPSLDTINRKIADMQEFYRKEQEKKLEMENKKIQELQLELASKNKEIEKLQETVETLKRSIPLAPTLVMEAYAAVAKFAGTLMKTVTSYGIQDSHMAIMDTEIDTYHSLPTLLQGWIELTKNHNDDFNKGASFALGLVKAVIETERILAEKIWELADKLEQ